MSGLKPRKLGCVLLVLLILGGGGYGGFQAWKAKTTVQPPEVQTEKVEVRDLVEIVIATGTLQPDIEVKISPEVSGEIIELPVQDGQRVTKGDLLVRIRPDQYEASFKSAQANLLSVRARERQAQATLVRTTADFQRIEQLFNDNLVSESELINARAAHDVAQADLESSRHQAEVAQASVDRAKEDLAKTTIYSPLTGTVTRLNSQAGERVVGTATMAGTEILTLADLDTMEARVDLAETDVVHAQPGQKARLEVDAFPDEHFTGTVTEIANTAKRNNAGGQQQATTFEVRIRLEEKAAFRPGMSVNADIETRYRTNAVSVSIGSVTTRLPGADVGTEDKAASTGERAQDRAQPAESGTHAPKPEEVVFVVAGDRVRRRVVKRGITGENHYEIESGLKPGEVIVSGPFAVLNRDLKDDLQVRIKGPEGDPPNP